MLLSALMLAVVALSGCSDDGGDAPADPAETCDGIFDEATETCTPHVEPTVVVEGLGDSVPAYVKNTFTWSLDNGTRGDAQQPVHSMDSRVLAVTDGTTPTNTTEPDSVGREVATAAHQNLPQQFEATFSWDTVGETVSLWGYMFIDGVHQYNQIKQVTVVEPPRTSVTQPVAISAGPPPTVDDSDLRIGVGDAFQFSSDAPYPYTVSFDCSNGVTIADQDLSGGSGPETPIFQPTNCDWVATSPLGATDNDPLQVSGSIAVDA